MSGEECEPNVRQRLGQPDQSERERVVRQRIHLPSDDDCLRLRAEGHREEAHDEPAEGAVAEGGVGIVRQRVPGSWFLELGTWNLELELRTSSWSTNH